MFSLQIYKSIHNSYNSIYRLPETHSQSKGKRAVIDCMDSLAPTGNDWKHLDNVLPPESQSVAIFLG